MSHRITSANGKAHFVLVVIAGLAVCSCQRGTEVAALHIPHPDDASKQVEYFIEEPAGKGPWPTIVFLHGHQMGLSRPGGKVFVEWEVLKKFANRGYLAVAISQPGYGNSTGPADFCGAFTQHAVSGVISNLRTEGLASPQKLVIQGASRGAVTAGLVAAHDPSVSGLVLISGVYDLVEYVEESKTNPEKRSVVKSLIAETGGTDDALRTRSVLRFANSIKASSLILSGEKDDRTDANQARRLAEDIVHSGGNARAIIYPDYGHKIPVDARNKDIDPFIDHVLGKSSSSRSRSRFATN